MGERRSDAGPFARRAARRARAHRVGVDRRPHRLDVGRLGEARGAFGVQQADGGVQLLARLEVERGVDRVDGNVDRAAVGLERQNVGHHLGGRPSELLAEGVKVLEVRLSVDGWRVRELRRIARRVARP